MALSRSAWDVTVPRALTCHGAAAQASVELGSPGRCSVSPRDPAATPGLGGARGPTGTKLPMGLGDSPGGTPRPPHRRPTPGSLPELVPGREQCAGGQGLRGEGRAPGGPRGEGGDEEGRGLPRTAATPQLQPLQQGPAAAAQGPDSVAVLGELEDDAAIGAILRQEGQGPPGPPRLWGQRPQSGVWPKPGGWVSPPDTRPGRGAPWGPHPPRGASPRHAASPAGSAPAPAPRLLSHPAGRGRCCHRCQGHHGVTRPPQGQAGTRFSPTPPMTRVPAQAAPPGCCPRPHSCPH